MGISHYYPRNADNIHYRIVNLGMSEELGYSYDNPDYAEDEAYFHSNFWNDLVESMQDTLYGIAPTGRGVDEWDGDAKIIYRTPLLEVTLTDNQVLFAIVVKTRCDFDGDREANLAPRHIDRVAERLFKWLQGAYGELSVPSGGYTGYTWNGDINTA